MYSRSNNITPGESTRKSSYKVREIGALEIAAEQVKGLIKNTANTLKHL